MDALVQGRTRIHRSVRYVSTFDTSYLTLFEPAQSTVAILLPESNLEYIDKAVATPKNADRSKTQVFCLYRHSEVCSRANRHKITQHPPLSLFSNVSNAARVAASNTSSTPSPVREEHSRYFRAPISRAAFVPSFSLVKCNDFLRISS